VAGDFNADGRPDVAVANTADNTATVFLNNSPAIVPSLASLAFHAGTGQVAPAAIPVSLTSASSGSVYTATSSRPWLIATPGSNATGGTTTVSLSVNPSGLAAGAYSAVVRYGSANFFGSSTTVALSVANPSGPLQSAVGSPIITGNSPQSVALADFNGDGNLDVVTANFGTNNITLLLGDGMGGFVESSHSPVAVGTNPTSIAVGDFNGDGHADVAVSNSTANTLTVLLGDGTGLFTPAAGSPYSVGAKPFMVVVGDFNLDGNADLAVANNNDQDFTILLGDGTGGFSPGPGSPYTLPGAPVSIATADLDGDGKPDIAVAMSNGQVSALSGTGLGGFGTAKNYPVGSIPQSIFLADMNSDGRPDIGPISSRRTLRETAFRCFLVPRQEPLQRPREALSLSARARSR
jgi:hypothetical protein